jgi:O-antigen/teichoic acid export membrane protein
MLGLSCSMITARSLGPAGRGEQSAILLWPYLVTGLAGFGIAPALSYYTSRSISSEGGLLFAASILAVVAGLVGSAVGSLILPHYLTRYSQDVIHAAQVIILFAPLILLGDVFRINLEARGEFSPSNWSRVWATLFTLLSLTLLWLVHALTPFSSSLALWLPSAAQTVRLGFDLSDRFSFDFRGIIPNSRKLLSYGLRTYGTEVFYAFSGQVDQAIVIAFLTPSALGLYAVALTASRTLNTLVLSLIMVLLPRACRLDFDSAIDLVGRTARINNLVTSIGALVLFAIIPVLLPLFYGKAFSSAVLITRVLILDALLMSAAAVLAQAFLATGRPAVETLLQAGWLLASVLFLTLLVPRMGLIGAAFALVSASLVRLLATLASYPLVLHRPLPCLVPNAGDMRYIKSKIDGRHRQ